MKNTEKQSSLKNIDEVLKFWSLQGDGGSVEVLKFWSVELKIKNDGI